MWEGREGEASGEGRRVCMGRRGGEGDGDEGGCPGMGWDRMNGMGWDRMNGMGWEGMMR